jgi:hypothetical protein
MLKLDPKHLSKLIRERKKKAEKPKDDVDQMDPSEVDQTVQDARVEDSVGFEHEDSPEPKEMSEEEFTEMGPKDKRKMRLKARLSSYMKL